MGRVAGEATNRDRYSQEAVVAHFASRTELKAWEDVLFSKYLDRVSDVLDIGIGAGRTTRHLAPGRRYVGIDWSLEMTRTARALHPDAPFGVAEATALPFSADEFGAAVFSFNGIDYVTRARRPVIYGEVRRVLRGGGVFLLSSHNPRYVLAGPSGARGLALGRWVVRFLLAFARVLTTRRFWQGYGDFLDPLHGGLVTVAESPPIVVGQLHRHGFVVDEVLPTPSVWRSLVTPWFNYAARLDLNEDGVEKAESSLQALEGSDEAP